MSADRQHFIGGSDAAGILGVSPWDTPLDVYQKKRGERAPGPPDLKREKLFKRGKRLEPVVIDMMIEELELKVTRRSFPTAPNRYIDATIPYIAAEIDYEWEVTPSVADRFGLSSALVGTEQNGEVKTVHPFAAGKYGEAESDEVPIEYAAQAMHGLMVRGAQLCLFGVLVGADNLVPYIIQRDDDMISMIRAKEIEFWQKHVLAGVPPAPVHLGDVMTLLRKAPASSAEANEEMLELCGELAAAKHAKSAAEDRETEIKYQLGKFVLGESGVLLGNHGKLIPGADVKPGLHLLTRGGAPLLYIRLQHQTRLDVDRIKAEYPEVAVSCSRESSSFRFEAPRQRRGR